MYVKQCNTALGKSAILKMVFSGKLISLKLIVVVLWDGQQCISWPRWPLQHVYRDTNMMVLGLVLFEIVIIALKLAAIFKNGHHKINVSILYMSILLNAFFWTLQPRKPIYIHQY
jgi:hypothetical protein